MCAWRLQPMPWVDIAAYTGYKFVSLALLTLVHIIAGSGIIYYILFFWFAVRKL